MKTGLVFALVVLTAACSAPAPNPRVPDPVLRACDLIAEIARRPNGVTIARSIGPFPDERDGRTRFGCSVSLEGSMTALRGGSNPVELLRERFAARGWLEDGNHAADGPDGTMFAFVRDGVICIFEGRWDGGDDSDPTYKPDDAYKGTARCAAYDVARRAGQKGF
jgi:hypothetical protein